MPTEICKINGCGKEFDSWEELCDHLPEHQVNEVSKSPLVAVISLPDGDRTGGWEAAESFAEGVKVLYNRYPGRTFSFTVFGHKFNNNGSLGGVESWLAVANPITQERDV